MMRPARREAKGLNSIKIFNQLLRRRTLALKRLARMDWNAKVAGAGRMAGDSRSNQPGMQATL